MNMFVPRMDRMRALLDFCLNIDTGTLETLLNCIEGMISKWRLSMAFRGLSTRAVLPSREDSRSNSRSSDQVGRSVVTLEMKNSVRSSSRYSVHTHVIDRPLQILSLVLA